MHLISRFFFTANFHFGAFAARMLLVFLGWLVGCFGLNGPLRQYFSLYRAVGNLLKQILKNIFLERE